jgi:hypothetical protein
MENTTIETDEKRFNDKIDKFKDHVQYRWLRRYADDALWWQKNFGMLQIKADDFIERILIASENDIEDWLNGKHRLEWKMIRN